VRRVFLCMFMFQYSPGNTVNNATGFYSREERDRLRRQVEAYMDSKIKQYAEEEAPRRGIPVDELLRKTVAEETERRAKADAFIRQKDGR